jgi:hypothetical protein
MNIKRMMAGFTVAVLMLGTLSTTCFAASAENDDSKTKPAAVTEGSNGYREYGGGTAPL